MELGLINSAWFGSKLDPNCVSFALTDFNNEPRAYGVKSVNAHVDLAKRVGAPQYAWRLTCRASERMGCEMPGRVSWDGPRAGFKSYWLLQLTA